MHSENFSKIELERDIYRFLNHDDEKDIAEIADSGYSILSQKFSPDNDRDSDIFRAACTFSAWMKVNCENARKALDTFNSYVSRACPPDESLDVETERRNHLKEQVEFNLAEIENPDDLDKQIKEGDEATAACRLHVAALRAKRAKLNHRAAAEKTLARFTTNGNGVKVNGGKE